MLDISGSCVSIFSSFLIPSVWLWRSSFRTPPPSQQPWSPAPNSFAKYVLVFLFMHWQCCVCIFDVSPWDCNAGAQQHYKQLYLWTDTQVGSENTHTHPHTVKVLQECNNSLHKYFAQMKHLSFFFIEGVMICTLHADFLRYLIYKKLCYIFLLYFCLPDEIYFFNVILTWLSDFWYLLAVLCNKWNQIFGQRVTAVMVMTFVSLNLQPCCLFLGNALRKCLLYAYLNNYGKPIKTNKQKKNRTQNPERRGKKRQSETSVQVNTIFVSSSGTPHFLSVAKATPHNFTCSYILETGSNNSDRL